MKELRLEIEPGSGWSKFKIISDVAKRLAIQLSEIAQHKRVRYPNLQVVAWQAQLFRLCQTLLLQGLHDSAVLLTHLKESEIRFFFSRDLEPSALDEVSCGLAKSSRFYSVGRHNAAQLRTSCLCLLEGRLLLTDRCVYEGWRKIWAGMWDYEARKG